MSTTDTSQTGSAVINTQGLSKTYDGVQALKSLDLQVPKNSIFGFLGPNGSGKTTTIKLLLGLARPTGGGGSIFGLDIVRDSVEIRKRIGYLAQDPRFYEFMTARETLRFKAGFFIVDRKPKLRPGSPKRWRLVGLADKADRRSKASQAGAPAIGHRPGPDQPS